MSRARGSAELEHGGQTPYWQRRQEQEVRKGPRKKQSHPKRSRKPQRKSGKRKTKSSSRRSKSTPAPDVKAKRERRALTDAFANLTDPRVNRRRLHLLIDIVVIAVCAVIAGSEKWKDIAAWGKCRRQWLARFLELPNGIPSGDTFRRVLCRLDPNEFQQCFLSWASSLVGAAKGRLLNIDGKTLRRSGRVKNEDKPLHIVSVWAAEQHLALGQTTVDEKSNEITAIPKLLRLIELEGALVTIDAMGCQKQIARQIVNGSGDYCLAVKGNQEHLEEDIGNHFTRCLDSDFAGVEHQRHTTSEKKHGRHERREYYLTEVPTELRHAEAWAGLKAVGMVVNIREHKNAEAGYVRYYICSFYDIERFAGAVRGHWGIENSLHWIMDVTFREDDSRIQNELGASNFSWLRRFAISLLKNEATMKDTVRQKRLRAGWEVEYLDKVLLAATPKSPEN